MGGTSGGSAGSGGTNAGATGFDWTLPHTSDKNWRNSQEPLCAPGGYGLPLDIWSDERGVFALAETNVSNGRTLSFNDGSGWSTVTNPAGSAYGLSGFRDGALILYSGDRCGVMFVDGDSETCASALPGTWQVFVVDSERTFAIAGNRVLHYNGSYFTQYGKPLPEVNPVYGMKLWADAEVVIALGELGLYVLSDAVSEAEIITLPEPEAPRSLWAFSRDDIWLGLEKNRLAHYDGAGWTVLPLGPDCNGGVSALWGSEGVLFAASSTFLGKVEGDAVHAFARARRCPPEDTQVGQHEALTVRKIWGNSAKEVFFAVTEQMYEVQLSDGGYTHTPRAPDACGMQRLYWSDGERLRPF